MLDSPYVRRVAISLQLLQLRFSHRSLSVFRTYDEFRKINPVVKAPTLVCDDGTILLDSTLILHYAEALARPRTLWPVDVPALKRELRITGLALAACDKSVQVVYEHGVRPAEKVHAPWLERVNSQLLAAYGAIEDELARAPLGVTSSTIGQAGVTVGIAWHFTQRMHPELVPAASFPRLAAFSATAEALPEFAAAPHGDGEYRGPLSEAA